MGWDSELYSTPKYIVLYPVYAVYVESKYFSMLHNQARRNRRVLGSVIFTPSIPPGGEVSRLRTGKGVPAARNDTDPSKY